MCLNNSAMALRQGSCPHPCYQISLSLYLGQCRHPSSNCPGSRGRKSPQNLISIPFLLGRRIDLLSLSETSSRELAELLSRIWSVGRQRRCRHSRPSRASEPRERRARHSNVRIHKTDSAFVATVTEDKTRVWQRQWRLNQKNSHLGVLRSPVQLELSWQMLWYIHLTCKLLQWRKSAGR